MKEKIVVTGSNGMTGRAMAQYFIHEGYEVVQLSREQFDIAKDSVEKLAPWIESAKAVVNCAGVTKQVVGNNSVEDVLRINTLFPRNLAQLCQSREVPCFHITTDCVYSGKKGNYSEKDFLDAEDVYGLSKAGGEPLNCMVLRTSSIGEEENGQARCLLEWARAQAGKEVNGFLNHHWNGVTTLYLAEIVAKILKNGLYKKGIFHVFSPEKVSKYELLKLIDETYHLGLKIKAIDAPVSCDRTLASVHPLSREISTKPLQKQLHEMRDFFSQSR